jgi:hypothetical protein
VRTLSFYLNDNEHNYILAEVQMSPSRMQFSLEASTGGQHYLGIAKSIDLTTVMSRVLRSVYKGTSVFTSFHNRKLLSILSYRFSYNSVYLQWQRFVNGTFKLSSLSRHFEPTIKSRLISI